RRQRVDRWSCSAVAVSNQLAEGQQERGDGFLVPSPAQHRLRQLTGLTALGLDPLQRVAGHAWLAGLLTQRKVLRPGPHQSFPDLHVRTGVFDTEFAELLCQLAALLPMRLDQLGHVLAIDPNTLE